MILIDKDKYNNLYNRKFTVVGTVCITLHTIVGSNPTTFNKNKMKNRKKYFMDIENRIIVIREDDYYKLYKVMRFKKEDLFKCYEIKKIIGSRRSIDYIKVNIKKKK